MHPRAKAAFISAYTRILIRAWSDETFADQLIRDPCGALAGCGLQTADGKPVEIIRTGDADPDLEVQIRLWNDGASSGRYVLYVPDMPVIETKELSEEDLDSVAGGGNGCCCCSPCCSAL